MQSPPTTFENTDNSAYTTLESSTRQTFVSTINTVCDELNVHVEWLSDFWVARLQKGRLVRYVDAYILPLNDAACAFIMRDKVATYEVLRRAAIPAVPHYLLRLPVSRDVRGAAARAVKLSSLPLVIKPCAGESGGFDVMKCVSASELTQSIRELAQRHQALAISPFQSILAEYRVVMLDGEPQVIFEKMLSRGRRGSKSEWRHNLSLGAHPRILTDQELSNKLSRIAQEAMHALTARFAAVDIIRTADEQLAVLEMNGGLSLSHFSSYSPECHRIATSIYRIAIKKVLCLA